MRRTIVRPSAETSQDRRGPRDRPRSDVDAGVAAEALRRDDERAAGGIDEQRLGVLGAGEVAQPQARRRRARMLPAAAHARLGHPVDDDLAPPGEVVARVGDVERVAAAGRRSDRDVLPVDVLGAGDRDVRQQPAGGRDGEDARAIAGVVVGPQHARLRPRQDQARQLGRRGRGDAAGDRGAQGATERWVLRGARRRRRRARRARRFAAASGEHDHGEGGEPAYPSVLAVSRARRMRWSFSL
ncbi:MAG: hypothetical protein ACR2H2_18220 [Solirubrobacteraceae bacterium]